MKLNDRLKQARSSLSLSQAEVAKMIGTYQQRYQHWESGHTRPDPEELKKLSDVLGVTTDWLLGGEATARKYSTEFEKEIFLLKEEAKEYGPEGVRKLRQIMTLLFNNKGKK